MRILVFSDTHLTAEFEPARCNYMMKLLKKVDQVVINGDFFESYVVDFEEFLKSEWRQLFPLFKSKRAIYLYGNHDLPGTLNSAADQFSIRQLEKLLIEVKDRQIIVMHGHQLAPEFDATFPKLTARLKHHYPKIFRLLRKRSCNGKIARFIKSFHNRRILRKMQQFARVHMPPSQILLTGHAHIQLDDRQHGLISLGNFELGVARYAIIDSSTGKITLYEENYEKLAAN